MFEVVVEAIMYIREVPVEDTLRAIEAGMVGRGSILGLRVHPVTDPENRVLVEVLLVENGQESLIQPGAILQLYGEEGVFSLGAG